MKNKKLNKLLIPLLLVMALMININRAKAQSTCATAVNGAMYTEDTYVSYQLNNDSVFWLKFTATNDTCMAFIANADNGPHVNVTKFTLYSGTCSSLVVNTSKNINSQDSINIGSVNLVVGNTYYLKISNTNISNACNFRLCLKGPNQNMIVYPCYDAICGNMVLNGNFSTVSPAGITSNLTYQTIPPFLTPNNWGINQAGNQGNPGWLQVTGINNGGAWDNFFLGDGFADGTISIGVAWSQTFTVIPNKKYHFSYYVRNLDISSLTPTYHDPKLSVRINSTTPIIYSNVFPSSAFYIPTIGYGSTWRKLCIDWVAGPTTTTAVVNIMDASYEDPDGNDFGLDSIFFGSLTSVSPNVTACPSAPSTLTACGGGSYLWSTGQTTSSIIVQPTTTTNYTVTVTNTGITETNAVTVTVINVDPPLFTGFGNTCSGLTTYTITNYSPPPVTYSYYINNGSPVAISPGSNTFTVNLAPYASTGCTLYLIGSDPTGTCMDTTSMFLHACCAKTGSPNVLNNTDAVASLPLNYYSGREVFINGIFTVNKNLTLHKCKLLMAPDAKIVVAPTFTFSLDSCYLDAYCDTMWDGIYAQTNTAKINLKNADTLRRAKNAVVSENGGSYYICTSLFEDNYIGAIIRNYSGVYTSSLISSSKFRSTGNNLLPPYQTNVRGYKGVEVVNVLNLVVGDTSAYSKRNKFLKLDYGITGERTNLKVYNNYFNKITNSTTAPAMPLPIGVCVSVRSAGAYGPFTPIVGGPNVTGSIKSNKMDTCFIGVHAYYNLNNLRVEYDTINLQTTSHTYPIGVYVYGSSVDNAKIRYNSITNGTYGIEYVEMKASSNITISNNLTSYSTNGIALTNVNATYNGVLYINNNLVYFPTTGILVTNCTGGKFKRIYVEANNIFFYNPNFTSFTFYGIRMQNCLWPMVDLVNTVARTNTSAPTATNAGNLNGIALETTDRAIVDHNLLTRMGCGIRYEGSMPVTTTTCNTMTSCFYGVKLVAANIGNQGGVGMPWDNQWISNYAAPGYRIQGTMSSFAPFTTWYYKLGANFQLPLGTWSVPPLTFTTAQTVDGLFCGSALMGSVSNIATPLARQTAIGAVVDSINPTSVALMGDESQYQEVKAVYNILKDEPALLDMNAIDDTKYQEFFNAAQESNIGKLNSVDSLIENDSANIANIANNNVEIQNMIEFNKTTVNEIYLRTWALGEFVLSNADSTTLLNIAMQNPLIAGEGVYGARVMIGLQFDNYASNERLTNNQTTIVPELEKTVKVYPNPAKEELSVEFSTLNIDKVLTFELYNAMGVLVYKQLFNGNDYLFKVSLNKITGGCYTYKIKDQNTIIAKNKLVIIK